jgi:hypothetical protein
VEAELVDSQGEKVATAEWSGSNGQVSLQFDALFSDMTPYPLTSVSLYDASGLLIDYAEDRAGVYSAGPFYSLGLSTASVVTPTVTSVSTPDSDGNGKYDSLDFHVNLTIAVPGNYRLEGWLEAPDGTLLAWQTSAPTALGLGTQSMVLAFSGWMAPTS